MLTLITKLQESTSANEALKSKMEDYRSRINKLEMDKQRLVAENQVVKSGGEGLDLELGG